MYFAYQFHHCIINLFTNIFLIFCHRREEISSLNSQYTVLTLHNIQS
jgi:hypothetical protein